MAIFRFKRFHIDDQGCGMKICSDSVLLGAWTCVDDEVSDIIDLGTGSGLLALMCAQRTPHASVLALEIDGAAADAARANFAASPWAERLKAEHADASAYAPPVKPQMIICNPPYFSTGMHSPDIRRAQARHADTLSPEMAIDLASQWLSDAGSLAMVTPADCKSRVIELAEMRRMKIRRICMVSTSVRKEPTRILWQISRIDGAIESSHLSIRDSSGKYTSEYTSLTSDFYL